MKKQLTQWLPVVIITGLVMYTQYFICWLLLISIIFGSFISFGYASLFKSSKKFKYPDRKIFNFIIRILLLAISLGGLYVFIFILGFHRLYLDIPNYLNKNYSVIEGKAYLSESTSGKGPTIQTIKINDVKLDNHLYLNITTYQGKSLKIFYLPNSKYVMEIWEKDSES